MGTGYGDTANWSATDRADRRFRANFNRQLAAMSLFGNALRIVNSLIRKLTADGTENVANIRKCCVDVTRAPANQSKNIRNEITPRGFVAHQP